MLRLLSGVLLTAAALFGQADGWKDIQPKRDLTEWTRISIPPGKPVTEPTQWKIDAAAGTLVCEGNGGHEMLRYNTEYQDFVLHAEWKYTKLADEAAKYNSGVFVRNDTDGSLWHQAQMGAAGGYLFGVTPKAGKPERFNLRDKMTENRILPAGEWNTYDITCKGKVISLAVNGKTVSECAECELLKGYIGLEAEGFRVEFRNLRIRSLPQLAE
jgi:hypothetical protein